MHTSMRNLLVFSLLLVAFTAHANKNTSAIYVNVQKLNSLDKILYVAAHPDDENTRALAWFSLGLHAETAYYSLTRGDGGQNLIGKELSEDLGVLRTQELLAARSYDGATQYFSKAVDFGYSKSAEESLEKWGKEEILAETVLMIRKFQPNVIITRFPPDERAGHGHHNASAMLAIEAFEKSADPTYLPEQVKTFGTWQATSIYWNSSTWSNKNVATEAIDNPDYLVKDIGGYNPLLGMSYNEIGTIARSQHKCQGFGAIVERGSRTEYFQYLAGKKLEESFFESNHQSWKNLLGEKMEADMNHLLNHFDFIHAENNIESLFNILAQLKKLPESTFKESKIKRCKAIILDCLGLNLEIISPDYALTKNDKFEVQLNAINRSNVNIYLRGISGEGISPIESKTALLKNAMIETPFTFTSKANYSTPYWLDFPFTNTFTVKSPENFLKAENDPTYLFQVQLEIAGKPLEVPIAMEYKERDPSYGERRRPSVSTPDYTINFNQKSIILKEGQSKTIELKIHSFKENVKGEVLLQAPLNWTLSQSKIKFNLKNKHEDQFIEIILTPKQDSKRGTLMLIDVNGDAIKSYTEIAYDHIPTQVIFKPATLECVKIDAKIKQGKIAYIRGAEDVVPEAIAQLGFEVKVFQVAELSSLDLSQFRSVVLGIRIYNVYSEIKNFEDKLFTYVKNGGNLVMQYNTASRREPDLKYGGPLPFELSRNRVTEEDAAVTFLQPKHPIMQTPNQITQEDFNGWVQERGLYFANNWDKNYSPLFAWSDKGEEAQKGALIVANYGKGQFVYTGISFFRELPNGVEGAYRLFANILSYEPR